ncbi:MAG: type III pantothenate kinase [Candidatus Omnitrophica bacterium]|nr:type III pantothenate kinase [Candidatus Omnitrophota bacterium]
MLLAVDIGNTNITFGLFRGKRLFRRFDIPTRGYSRGKLKNLLKKAAVEGSIVCSVVPAATRVLARDLSALTGSRPYIIGKDIWVPIKNLYRKPKEVGQDRLVNAYTAARLYGAPAIVVDCGTAVTLDVVSRNTEYLGGMILPGLGISLDALYERTALLPKVKLTHPGKLIGRDTRSSILSGLVYGLAASIDELSRRIKQKIGRNALVIATGGNIGLIKRYCNSISEVDPDLTLKGLRQIYDTIK